MHASSRKQREKEASKKAKAEVPAITLEMVMRENPGITIADAFQKLEQLRAQEEQKKAGGGGAAAPASSVAAPAPAVAAAAGGMPGVGVATVTSAAPTAGTAVRDRPCARMILHACVAFG